ncbi:alpha/beta hydrolase [Kutzneria sp. NPDC052558]|uniref:alpha/beta hydrolase n=1 Tax=Kutzneria sp. NPDC052558 TaxID=3364121 RepID=UPI0037C7A0F5
MGISALAIAVATVASLTAAPHPVVDWHACATGPDDAIGRELDDHGGQCAEITVPVDYTRLDGRRISIAISRIRATDPARRRGVMLLNPGGPGGSGLEMAMLGAFSAPLGAAYDLIGFDPRFVGRSAGLTCGWTTSTFQRSAGPDRRSYTENVALQAKLAAGCVSRNRDLLPYASTRNTARDMDVIRQALGEQRISYYGDSYGTYLGAVYLQMFGDRADRVVLDSAVDPDKYGPDLFANQSAPMALALNHFAQWAAGKQGIGATAQAVLDTVNRLVRSAPAHVGKYTLDDHVLPLVIYAGLVSDDDASYTELATEIRQLRDSSPTPTAKLAGELDGLFNGSADSPDQAGTSILCADRAVPRDPAVYYRDIQAHRGDEPLFGPIGRNITPCAFWPTAPVEPPTKVHNGSPVLIVSAEHDPITPYAGQLVMHKDLTGSRMVTQLGAYHHGVFLGDDCVDAAVVAYLTGGPLPTADRTCA